MPEIWVHVITIPNPKNKITQPQKVRKKGGREGRKEGKAAIEGGREGKGRERKKRKCSTSSIILENILTVCYWLLVAHVFPEQSL